MTTDRFLNEVSPEEVNKFHDNDDVDGGPKSHHHTLGPHYGQASPGHHEHDGSDSAILSGYMGTHNTQTGHAIIPEAVGMLHVEFDPPFENTPRVYATCRGFYIAYTDTVTPESMNLLARKYDGSIHDEIVKVDWIATDI